MRYDVDPAALHELAAGLRDVATTIAVVPALGPDGLDTGSPAVSSALAEVVHDWGRARRRIREELSAMSRATELAARAYERADQDVAGACGR